MQVYFSKHNSAEFRTRVLTLCTNCQHFVTSLSLSP
jgi:hypothetical protein